MTITANSLTKMDQLDGFRPLLQSVFFRFRVDGRAPLQEVRCTPTDRLIHPRRDAYGSTSNNQYCEIT